jgi:iron complex outermembrane receptor protein
VQGKTSPGVNGAMTPEQAVNRLLAGTGLSASVTGGNTVTVTGPGGGTSGAVQLDPVQVQGYLVPPQAMIDNLPPPYAGGLVGSGSQLGVLGERGVMDTPFNQTSYTSKLMQDQQAQTLGDVVSNDPSVRVGSPSSSGLEDFAIRGFAVANGDILFTGLAGVTPTVFNSMMTEGLERVEVLKGASAFLNGAGPAGSVGGVINVIPKRAGKDPITQFTPTYSTNSQFGGHVDFGRRFGDNEEFGVRINAVYRDGSTPIDLQTSQQARLFTLGADYRGNAVRASLDFGYQYQYLQAPRRFPQPNFGIVVPAAPTNTTNYNFAWEYNAPEVFYGAVRGEYDITDNLTAFASLGGSDRSQFNIRTNPFVSTGFGTIPPGNAFVEATRVFSGALEAGVRSTFETGPIRHQMTLSYNRYGQSFYRQRNFFAVPASNIYNPAFSPAPPASLMPSPDGSPKQSQQDLGSMAIGDTLSIWSERLQFTAGVRAQNIKAWNFNPTTGAVTSSYDETATSPMFAILGKPWQSVSLYANYIQGLQQGAVAPAGTLNAGQVFAPFLSTQYEVGAKVDWGGKLTTTLAAYQLSQPFSFINPQTNLFAVDGKQRNRGLEFNVFGEPVEGLRVLGGASYIEARQEATGGGLNQGNYAIGVPVLQLVAGGEWDVPVPALRGLTLVGRLVYSSSAFLDAMNVQQVPEFAQVNVGLRYTYERANGKPIVVRATVDNLFNASYWDPNTFGQLSLSNPRTFLLSTSFNF